MIVHSYRAIHKQQMGYLCHELNQADTSVVLKNHLPPFLWTDKRMNLSRWLENIAVLLQIGVAHEAYQPITGD